DGAAEARDLLVDVRARGLEYGVVGVDVAGVETDAGLRAACLGALRRRGEGDRGRRAAPGHFDPAHVGAPRGVDGLPEPEGADVEVDRAVGVGDGDAHAADLGEIELGHFESLLCGYS